MPKKFKIPTLIFLTACALAVFAMASRHGTLAILYPQGWVGLKERNLMITATVLMLVIVAPVLGMIAYIPWKYRDGNTTEKYAPDWADNAVLESVWWGIPCLIIASLATITWVSAHQLDPIKPLGSSVSPITIQVVALQWKWLFIYPEQNIATVNFFQFPEGTPVNFQLTSDAPMNSFWIPQLGGQIYAMSGMTTQLHLIADKAGTYAGSSANLSGKGFAGMKFAAKSSSRKDFDAWVALVRDSHAKLTTDEYAKLAAPSEDTPVAYYATTDQKLYTDTVMKFMIPPSKGTDMHGMQMSH
jgi:cytochrome o ubiquinol oxidase subunit 2